MISGILAEIEEQHNQKRQENRPIGDILLPPEPVTPPMPQVIDAVTRIGGQKDLFVEPTLGAESPWNYRNKMQFPIGRSKGKTVVTVLSLSLAVVLTTITATFVGGFDMDKYLSKSICTDFVLADAWHFQVGDTFHAGMALPQEVIDQVTSQGGVAGSMRTL